MKKYILNDDDVILNEISFTRDFAESLSCVGAVKWVLLPAVGT